MKKVLLISYYWPPAGGGGVQRWLKMSKYLQGHDWQLVVYTPENGEVPVEDASLEAEVHPNIQIVKHPIWEPYQLYKKFTGKKSSQKVYSGFINDKKETIAQKISVFVRGNFFIPDARKFWIKPSVKFLHKYLKINPVDAIISTGPPHSMHLIAHGVTKRINIPWIADFRDPWTNIDFYDQLRLTSIADKKHKRLEQTVLRKATRVVTVSNSWCEEFEQLSGRDDIRVITNGFDPADFQDDHIELLPKFTLCHIGSMNKDRDPVVFWEALESMITEGKIDDFEIRLIGQVDNQIMRSIEDRGLTKFLNHVPFMPHDEVIKEIQKSSVLLIPINKTPNSAGVIPGKIFEYLGAKRPVLGIGPTDGDSAKILLDSQAGKMVAYDDLESMKTALTGLLQNHLEGNSEINSKNINQFSRQVLAESYRNLLNEVTG